MPSNVSMKQLLETGVHFGHRTTKWNPKMDDFIFTARNGIHIIDLTQTLRNLNVYYDMIAREVANGGVVLFVGTKRQAQETIAREAARCGMPHVNTRWLGGTLTNWRTISSRIQTLKKLEKMREAGEFKRLTKKEALINERKIEKLQLRLGGLRDMKKLPSLVVIVDTEREETAVREANKLNIPVLGIVDTNGDPDLIDYILPANDDAMRSIHLLIKSLADAVLEGRAARAGADDAEEEFVDDSFDGFGDDVDDDALLGESTIRKLQDARLFDDDESEDDDSES